VTRHRSRRPHSIATLLILLLSRLAGAQTISLTPSDPKTWDSAVTIGWLGGNKGELAEEYNDWYDTFATSVDLGRYWTPHLKTEIGGTFTTQGSIYVPERITIPGQAGPVFVSREHRYRVASLNLTAAYQFLENAWVHPFVAGGLQVAWERRRIQTPFPPFGRDGSPVPVPPALERPGTNFEPRPFVSGGAKFYVSERAFLRTDLSAAYDDRGAARVWWRAGAGVDF
jgi:hypothetical protein